MIRPATDGDRYPVLELARAFVAESHYREVLDGDEGLDELFDHTLEHGAIWLAWERVADNIVQAVGVLALIPVIHPISKRPIVTEAIWYVRPSHRGGRIGPKLLRLGEAWTRQKGLSVLQMVAPAGSDVGRFLERAGYRAIETLHQKVLT